MNINNLRIGQRLAIGFGVVIALLVLLAGLSYTRLASLNAEMGALIHLRYANTVSANAIKADVNEATRGMLSVLVMSDPDQVRKELDNARRKSANASAAVANLAHTTDDAEAARILASLGTIQAKFLPAQDAFTKLVLEERKDEAMVKFMFSLRPQQTKYFEQLDKFIAYQNAAMTAAGDAAATLTRRTQLLVLGLAGCRCRHFARRGLAGNAQHRAAAAPRRQSCAPRRRWRSHQRDPRGHPRRDRANVERPAPHERQPAAHRGRRARQHRGDGVQLEPDCQREYRSVGAHRTASRLARPDGRFDARTHRYGPAKRGQRTPGERPGRASIDGGRARRRRGGASGRHHGLDHGVLAAHRRHHRRHRFDRLPDEYPGPECGGGSGARRRAGARLCRRRGRGAQPGATLGWRRQGNQGADRRLQRQGARRAACWSSRPAPPCARWSTACAA